MLGDYPSNKMTNHREHIYYFQTNWHLLRNYPSNKMTNHREHTYYFQKMGTKREKT
ncbi:hypothetical protein Hanom_Chr03g00251981 [Helianthus anomalus]